MAESDLQEFFTKVDGSYPARHKDLAPVITWKTSKTPVARQFRLPIPVEHSGTVVDYSFETLNNDIEFGVLFSTATDSKEGMLGPGTGVGSRTEKEEEEVEEEEEVVVERQRFASHLGPVTGTFHLARPGRLTLVWDNGYSWFKNKVLSYSVTRHVPSMNSTEMAKCWRAAEALGTCAKERDGASARARVATIEGEESDTKVKELQEQLKELQEKLNMERQHAEALWEEAEDMQRRKELEELKIQGLAFRVMPIPVLTLTLSFGSVKEQWPRVCKDWHDALQSEESSAPTENGGHVEGMGVGEQEGKQQLQQEEEEQEEQEQEEQEQEEQEQEQEQQHERQKQQQEEEEEEEEEGGEEAGQPGREE